jgi:protein-L-isoaspartate(D-aspartate) O-methyltransferase
MSRANNEYREDEFVAARKLMIRQDLIGRGIQSTSVLAALEQTPREQFVLDADGHLAYADCALPISCGQTISQPYMVALMTDLLDLSGEEHVLEIGTGSGYQTAILAQLAHDVVTFERHTVLSRQAESRLKRLGLNNVVFVVGDGSQASVTGVPYDRILVTAAAPRVPPRFIHDLCPGGILVAPIGREMNQVLIRGVKTGDELAIEESVHCRFVPLITDVPENDE